MNSNQTKQVLDTNVPITANRASVLASVRIEELYCIKSCVEAIESVVKNGGLVMDDGDDIYAEYRTHLSFKGQPGVGDRFFKWVHDHRWTFPAADRVKIHRSGTSYDEFPQHRELETFDDSDRKFVAVANGHHQKPPILQATDSKWWGWKDALAEVGIDVIFLCQDAIEMKFREKNGL
ncbi:MAG: hypothetical protein R3E01_22225 [Pirellulaceae bacterium]